MMSFYHHWFPLQVFPDSLVLEQALQNPKTSTGLNEWMDARLDVKLKQVNDKMDNRFAQTDAKMDGRFAQMDAKMDGRFAQMDGRLEQMNIKLDSKSELVVELLKETTKAQEATISKQNAQLQELLSVAAVNRMLEVQNAELRTRVEKYERMLFKNSTPDA
jgi:hypothetical protein